MDYKGFEIGFFKLKDGVSDADVIKASRHMEDHLISRHQGFIDHKIIKISDTLYADIALAKSKMEAVEICNSWIGNPYSEPILELIEPVQFEGLEMLNFGDVIHSYFE